MSINMNSGTATDFLMNNWKTEVEHEYNEVDDEVIELTDIAESMPLSKKENIEKEDVKSIKNNSENISINTEIQEENIEKENSVNIVAISSKKKSKKVSTKIKKEVNTIENHQITDFYRLFSEVSGTKSKKTLVALQPILFDLAKETAKEKNISFNKFVIECLLAGIEKHKLNIH